jgi:hypothetical protein
MNRFSLLILLITFSCTNSVKQSDTKQETGELPDTFKDLVELFQEKPKSIPRKFLTKYLEIDSSKFPGATYTTFDFRQLSADILGLIYKVNCSAGGVCEVYSLVTYNNSGQLIDHLEIGHEFADNAFSRLLEYEIVETTIFLKSKDIQLEENKKGETIETVKAEQSFSYSIDPLRGTITKNE